jgi:hypothetical protein
VDRPAGRRSGDPKLGEENPEICRSDKKVDELWITDYRLWIIDYGLWIMDLKVENPKNLLL